MEVKVEDLKLSVTVGGKTYNIDPIAEEEIARRFESSNASLADLKDCHNVLLNIQNGSGITSAVYKLTRFRSFACL